MRLTRRTFVRTVAVSGAAALVPWRLLYADYQTPGTIPLFGTALRGVGPGGIPVAAPDAFAAPVTGVTHYTIDIANFSDPGVCPGLGPTALWGYHPASPLGGGAQPQRHLGGIIVAQTGTPLQITFRNRLNVEGQHLLPHDTTIMNADQSVDRVAVHLHGGLVPWVSDGGPFAWFDPRGNRGPSFLNNQVFNPQAAANEAEYYYPNSQSARMLWYHDHAMGITRLNAYAGIASAYILRDAFEINLKNRGLPEFIENSVLGGTTIQELPLVVQDKTFVGSDIGTADPGWGALGLTTAPGSLWYPHVYESELEPPNRLPTPSVVPEFFGDTMLVNGTAYPRVAVEPRRYRLRILNACNARFLNLQLYLADGSPDGITLKRDKTPLNRPFIDGEQGRPAVLQIGTEGGFLPRPALVPTNITFNAEAVVGRPGRDARRRRGKRTRIVCEPRRLRESLLLGPGERADVIIDFSRCRNTPVVLYNDAPSPFPMGDPEADFFPGLDNENPVNQSTPPGFGPNTRVLMRFDVGSQVSGVDAPLRINTRTSLLPGIDPLLVPLGVSDPPPWVPVRRLTLNEAFDEHGRLLQLVGTDVDQGGGQFGQPYTNPATETPLAGSTEVWEVYNLSADVHPMHFHLVNVQIINRQPFDPDSFDGEAHFTGAAVPPAASESGWKDTVRMYPGTVTRVIMKFDVPTRIATARPPRSHDRPGFDPPGLRRRGSISIPSSPRTGGSEFVWHCHILEHEEHDMMRPLIVI